MSILVSLWLAQVAGCVKDTDCKGERICEAGACVEPRAPAPVPAPLAPPPPPAPDASYPRVVRRDGQVCVQTLEADGRVEESCRSDEPASPAPRVRSRKTRATARAEEPATEREEPRARFVASFLLHGGLLAAVAGGSTAALPQLGTTLALGSRFRSGVGVAGLGSLSVGFAPGGALFLASLTPALRFGDRSHFLLGVGPTLVAYSFRTGGGSGAAGSVLAAGVFALGEAFALTIHSALHVDASGVIFTLGAGFGLGAF